MKWDDHMSDRDSDVFQSLANLTERSLDTILQDSNSAHVEAKVVIFSRDEISDSKLVVTCGIILSDTLEIISENKIKEKVLKNFRKSVVAIKTLKEKLHLSDGDIEILKQYFFILDLQPKFTDIKKCFELFSDYTTPQFRLAFGGTEFNIRQIENLVRLDDSSYIHYIDDDFTSTSLDVKGFINGFDSEIVYAIAVSDKTRTISVVFRGSSNLNDWLTNVQTHFTDCVVPGFTSEEEMKSMERISIGNVHKGFYKYLFEETEEGKNGSTKSKGEDIVGENYYLLLT